MKKSKISIYSYADTALPHLGKIVAANETVLKKLAAALVKGVPAGKRLLVFGSGHSAIFPMELYHRAGGAAFVVPVVAEYLLPTAGPSVVRVLERTSGAATPAFNRVAPKKGEMLWLASNSGINAAVVELALEAGKRGLKTVAFTNLAHSRAVPSRHASGKRLFEVCDEVVDIGGVRGDAAIPLASRDKGTVSAGPLSTLSTVLLGNSVLVLAMAELEKKGHPCVYTSVNTPEGETRNRKLEAAAAKTDFLLR
ncbi:MAG: sugar isomerase domain-containing protein [Oligoflexia bacterium]|nr:sugar isomerase domain-containing protein [Oligoflexia bacterium]